MYYECALNSSSTRQNTRIATTLVFMMTLSGLRLKAEAQESLREVGGMSWEATQGTSARREDCAQAFPEVRNEISATTAESTPLRGQETLIAVAML